MHFNTISIIIVLVFSYTINDTANGNKQVTANQKVKLQN